MTPALALSLSSFRCCTNCRTQTGQTHTHTHTRIPCSLLALEMLYIDSAFSLRTNNHAHQMRQTKNGRFDIAQQQWHTN